LEFANLTDFGSSFSKESEMKRFYVISALFAATLLSAHASFSQSTDRDDPTPMSSAEISGTFGDHQEDNNRENYYSFTAGPGQLSVVMDIRRRGRDDTGRVSFELLAGNGSTVLLCCEGAQSGDGGTGRETASVKLSRRQVVVLHVTNGSDGGGTFNARFSGASASFGGEAVIGEGGGDNGNGNGRGEGRGSGGNNRGGDPVEVPASGILHIRMKDGSVRDFDLSRVRNITVRP
jgi:hypothetical protein